MNIVATTEPESHHRNGSFRLLIAGRFSAGFLERRQLFATKHEDSFVWRMSGTQSGIIPPQFQSVTKNGGEVLLNTT